MQLPGLYCVHYKSLRYPTVPLLLNAHLSLSAVRPSAVKRFHKATLKVSLRNLCCLRRADTPLSLRAYDMIYQVGCAQVECAMCSTTSIEIQHGAMSISSTLLKADQAGIGQMALGPVLLSLFLAFPSLQCRFADKILCFHHSLQICLPGV